MVERGGRVFPVRQDAQEIVDSLTNWVRSNNATIVEHARVQKILTESEAVTGVVLTPHQIGGTPPEILYHANNIVLATGGASYPGTGSTGDGYTFAKELGHTIVPIRPALVPLETHGNIAARLQGLSLRNVQATVLVDEKPLHSAFGEMLFTHFGLSGPIILSLSKGVVDALSKNRTVAISIDLKPALDNEKLDARLLRDLDAHGKKQYKTLLQGLLPRKLISICIEQTGVPSEKQAHQISAVDRSKLRSWLKDFRFGISGHRGFQQAIVTAGGVSTQEVDPRSMASRLIRGLYFAGEVLDVDADTGGYNLQSAFSTGRLAGITVSS